MIARIALAGVLLRPWRSVFLLVGYGLGVGVMIVLLSVGEAMLVQARSERLVGGGDVTVLPEGIDVEVMKTGGIGGMFFSIPNARFVYRQVLASPRLAAHVRAAAPQVEGKLLYVGLPDGREVAVRASGEVPSVSLAVGAGPTVISGEWRDDDGDRRWIAPTAAELRHEIDRFHIPTGRAASDSTWAEWHYFNVLSPDGKRWAFITLIVGGDVPDGRWGGQVLVTLHEQGKPARRFVTTVGSEDVRFSTARADLSIGRSSVVLRDDGSYVVRARAASVDGGSGSVDVGLTVVPEARAYFPAASLVEGEVTSGYAVPALRATASGSVCAPGWCERVSGVPAYHDHNWGTWGGVTWEWGAARAGEFSLLYGRVQPPDSAAASQPLFVYVVDSLGFVALFRPRTVEYTDGRRVEVSGRSVAVPSRGVMFDARGDDTLRIELEVEDATATDLRSGQERGGVRRERPYFVQMKGRARVSGRVGGRVVRGEGVGFFETYR